MNVPAGVLGCEKMEIIWTGKRRECVVCEAKVKGKENTCLALKEFSFE